MSALRRHRRRSKDGALNHEAWAIPFADLMTLLLAFFVVMYAISSLNTGKYRVLADALSVAFRGDTASDVVGPASPIAVPTPVAAPLTGPAGGRPSPEEVLNAGRIAMRVARAAAPLVMRDQVTIRQHATWVEVEIRNDILFASGSATLNPRAEQVLAELAGALMGFGNAIRVEGHTDDVPIQGGVYRDNWDLSAARAGAVVRVLVDNGLQPARFAVLGFGEHRPIQANDTEAGRRANRRVLLAILGADEVAEGEYGRQRGTGPTVARDTP